MSTYTDLMTYYRCPRLYGFGKLGYQPIEQPEAITTGTLVHAAIASYFRGQSWLDTIKVEEAKILNQLQAIDDNNKRIKAMERTATASQRAQQLVARYIEYWTKCYTVPMVEGEYTVGKVTIHPDLVAYFKPEPDEDRSVFSSYRVVVDYKTSRSPDLRWYNVSGQVDLYAYVLNQLDFNIELVIYDVISEEGIFRTPLGTGRWPDLEVGEALFDEITELEDIELTGALEHPHYQFNCPQGCRFWEPCYLLQTDGIRACEDYLEKYFIKEVQVG